MNFLKAFLAALLALFVFSFLGLIILIGIAASAGSSKEAPVPDNAILHLKLNGPIVENAPVNPDDIELDLSKFIPGGVSTSKTGLHQLVMAIRQAKDDKRIRGIFFNPELAGVNAGWSSLRTIHKELKDFKAAGKFIYAYAQVYDEKGYYLASLADRIYLPSSGFIEFNGFAANPMYLTGLFEKLGVEPQIYKVGTFKAAVEPYYRKDMSPENRLQLESLLNTMWQEYTADLSAARGVSAQTYDSLAQKVILGDGRKALAARLVDELAYSDAVLDKMKEAVGIEKDKKLNLIELRKYMRAKPLKSNTSKNTIAVVFADGEINSGENSDGVIGDKTTVEALRKAREDKSVKAVVLRVNSPGGSALASDIIAREVLLTKQVKPVICSMGDVAASGGYYIAAYCDKIYADRNTITGSIGIFGLQLNTGKMFNDKLGITFDHVETHEFADIGNPNFQPSEPEKAFFQRQIERGYGTFINVVQQGRSKWFADSASVDKVGQGRVWSGIAAKEMKLVDEHGNLYDALAAAAKAANIGEDYRVRSLPAAKTGLQQLLDAMGAAAQAQHPLHEELKTIEEIRSLLPGNGMYARMPYTLDVK